MITTSDPLVTKSDKIIFVVIGLLFILAIVFWSDLRSMITGKSSDQKEKTEKDNEDGRKKNKKDKSKIREADPGTVAASSHFSYSTLNC